MRARRYGKAILEVSDSGEGMPPELIGRVFDLFVQGERSLARQPGGLGIGLTMAKRLAELHGGTMRAESAWSGQGRAFRARAAGDRARGGPAGVATPTTKIAMPRRVLIIEDDDDARDSLAELLRLDDHQVSVACDGKDGVELAGHWRRILC